MMIDRSVTCVRPGFFRRCASGLLPEGWATGVGRTVTIVPRCVDFSIGRPDVLGRPMIPSHAFGVGKCDEDEEALAVMGCTDVGSSKACPSDMHPVFGQVSENSIEPQRPVAGHIFQDRVSGS